MCGTVPTITPYYHDPESQITVYCGDTLEVLQQLDVPIHAVVTDPPYASGARTEAAKASSGAMVRGQRWNSKPIENDQMTTTGFIWLIRETILALKPNLTEGADLLAFIDWRNWPNMVGAVESTNLRVNNMVVWDKISMGLGNGFRAQHELILHASAGTHDPAAKDCANVLRHMAELQESYTKAQILEEAAKLRASAELMEQIAAGIEGDGSLATKDILGTVLQHKRDSNEWHPSPKPVGLMMDLLRVVAKPGHMVIDPFMGAGATLVACKQMGIPCIGIDIKPEHVAKTVERLSQVMPFMAAPIEEDSQEPLF